MIEMMVRRFDSDAEGLALWSARRSWSMRMVRAAPDGKGGWQRVRMLVKSPLDRMYSFEPRGVRA